MFRVVWFFYLKVCGIETCLLIVFIGPRVQPQAGCEADATDEPEDTPQELACLILIMSIGPRPPTTAVQEADATDNLHT